MADSKELQTYLKVAKEAASIGRATLLDYYGRLKSVEEKPKAGLVSEADKESESKIRKHFQTHTPDFDFLGEEEGLQRASSAESRGRWICDPLDGTTNYVHQFPLFCVSIGLQIDGEVVVGVVDVPCLNQVYSAIKGGGAFLNDEPIRATQIQSLDQGLFVTGFSSKRGEEIQTQIETFVELMKKARGVRRTGSAAIDLCLVASGIFDGFWEKYLNPWDTAAGALLVQEAGGLVTDFSGNPYDPFCDEVLACGSNIHPSLKGLIQSKSYPT